MSHEICLSRCSLGPMNQYRPLVTLQESEPNKCAGNHLLHPSARSYCYCQQFKFRKATIAAIADVPLPGPPWSHVSSLASKSIETPLPGRTGQRQHSFALPGERIYCILSWVKSRNIYDETYIYIYLCVCIYLFIDGRNM